MTQDTLRISHPKLIIFTAPSGAGKTTIVHRLLRTDSRLAFSVSATTRKKREKEVDGLDYYFLSEDAFKEKVRQEEFVEWEEVYAGIFYGTLKSEVQRLSSEGKAILFDIDVKGALNIKRQYGDSALAIFVQPPSLEILKERLRNRKSENDESLTKRMERAEYEMSFADKFDTVVMNDNLEQAVEDAKQKVGRFLELPK